MNRAIPCGRFYIAQVQKWAVDWVEVEKWCKNLTYKVSDTAFAVNYKSSRFKVKPWLGMWHMTPVSNQYECKLEVLPLNLPTGHPLTFPLSCLMDLMLQEQFHETLSSWHFPKHDCSCVAVCSSRVAHSCPKLKFAYGFTNSPARNQRHQIGS